MTGTSSSSYFVILLFITRVIGTIVIKMMEPPARLFISATNKLNHALFSMSFKKMSPPVGY
jgi:hypothetical protein